MNGEILGLTKNKTLIPSLKKTLIAIRGEKCEICGWDKVNPYTKKVPIVADHVDGNHMNNRPENI